MNADVARESATWTRTWRVNVSHERGTWARNVPAADQAAPPAAATPAPAGVLVALVAGL
ncbi:hypothetical protein GA0115255_123501, partial [Streptomyces sp. Ncost-T6T-2b]